MIYEAIEQALTERPARRPDGMLWVSDLGKNPAFAMRRIITGEWEAFDTPTLIKMDNGSALESATMQAVSQTIPHRLQFQLPLWNDLWSGYADLVVYPEDGPPVIVEHKATGAKWWDYRQSLPRGGDMCQLWLYGQLFEEMHGVAPELRIFYRSWGAWAEFEITFDGETLNAKGFMTDERGNQPGFVNRFRRIRPDLLRDEIEGMYVAWQAGGLGPLEVPVHPDWDYAEESYDRLVQEERKGQELLEGMGL